MDRAHLREWLARYQDVLFAFTDFEFSSDGVDDPGQLDSWFRSPNWNQRGLDFVPLGHDASGGLFALWIGPRSGGPDPVVFFGSEGGAVIARSSLAFVRALAHGAIAVEYDKGDLEAPSRLSVEDNWMLAKAARGQPGDASAALLRYRTAVESSFGALPPFAELVVVPSSVQTEFRTWVTDLQEAANTRERQESAVAAERKRLELRAKASRHAVVSPVPEEVASRSDGSRFAGACAACGRSTTLRLTRYEELAFGVCTDCYFSNAW